MARNCLIIFTLCFPKWTGRSRIQSVGPKMTALSEYLDKKLTSCAPVAFNRLVHADVMERLSHVREIKLIHMRVDATRSEVLAPFGEGWIDTAKG